jgi:tetratricopeptide (TPR) repeat protein
LKTSDGSPVHSGNGYERWSERGRKATLEGEFRTALHAYRKARRLAEEEADPARTDAADLNISMVLLQMGQAREGEDGLREILLRTSDHRIAFSAAYNIGSSLRSQGKFDRALAYAARALDRARAIEAVDLRATCHNLIGNIHLSRSYLDEALREYTLSLALRESLTSDTRYSRAILLENIGYCLLLMKEYRRGIARIREAFDLADQVGDRRCKTECLQDLCYGMLLQGKNLEAIRLGTEALEAAVEAGYPDIEENCHYLLGELGTQTGNLGLRDEHFQRLQDLHPELPFLREFLCTVDVTNIITLKR